MLIKGLWSSDRDKQGKALISLQIKRPERLDLNRQLLTSTEDHKAWSCLYHQKTVPLGGQGLRWLFAEKMDVSFLQPLGIWWYSVTKSQGVIKTKAPWVRDVFSVLYPVQVWKPLSDLTMHFHTVSSLMTEIMANIDVKMSWPWCLVPPRQTTKHLMQCFS